MPVITAVIGSVSEMAATAGGEDAIFLTSEERASAHMAAVTEGEVVQEKIKRALRLIFCNRPPNHQLKKT
jgi:hypothetical protein